MLAARGAPAAGHRRAGGSSRGNGAFESPISLDDFEDITRTRVLLETVALQQSIELGDDNWEASVVAAFHMLSRAEEKLEDGDAAREEWEERNRVFPRGLDLRLPVPLGSPFPEHPVPPVERYRRLSLFRQPISRDVHAEHQAIVDAALPATFRKPRASSPTTSCAPWKPSVNSLRTFSAEPQHLAGAAAFKATERRVSPPFCFQSGQDRTIRKRPSGSAR
jgi:hypothetical protein